MRPYLIAVSSQKVEVLPNGESNVCVDAVVLSEEWGVRSQRVADDQPIERVASPVQGRGGLNDGEQWLIDDVQAHAGLEIAENVGTADFQPTNLVQVRQLELNDW